MLILLLSKMEAIGILGIFFEASPKTFKSPKIKHLLQDKHLLLYPLFQDFSRRSESDCGYYFKMSHLITILKCHIYGSLLHRVKNTLIRRRRLCEKNTVLRRKK